MAVIGGGIAGLATAFELTRLGADVEVFEREQRVGGRIDGGPFAGLPYVDSGADAFLARVPEGTALAMAVGHDELTSPQPVGAAVWRDELHPIPEGLVLGVPSSPWPLARSGLLTRRGKLRAALEPLLPRTSLAPDSVGAFVRARFGDEVHEMLVDSLVGSIYATDTDRFSLAEVPQLHALASEQRSVLLAARGRGGAGTATAAAAGPVFSAPVAGMRSLVEATATAVERAGGAVHTGRAISGLERDGARWRVDGDAFDAVVLATPPHVSARALHADSPDAAAVLARSEHADVVMVALHLPAAAWPDRLNGLSGYLVPKRLQRHLTAVSFGSQKWSHWQPPSGGVLLRASLGRDGLPVLHLDDDEILDATLADLSAQLGIDPTPLDVRITRWPGAFAQYRPHHERWVSEIERALPERVFVTGAGYRGIGIPACIRDGKRIANRTVQSVAPLP